MEKIDFRPLYLLQDRLLESVFALDTGFYLTGGTCLHRFYHEDRYSVDLDLFTSDNTMFRQDVRKIIDAFNRAGINHLLNVDTRDFVRIVAEKALQVDMVNDRVFRAGQSLRLESGIILDNIQNISANKICAVLGRDDPKDIFDLYAINIRHAPDWPVILDYAARKCAFDPETLRFRLNSFPLELIDMVHAVDTGFVERIKQEYDRMVRDIAG